MLTVAKDGTGDFSTIQAAIDAAHSGNRASTLIVVAPGEYHEKVHITKDNLRIVGVDPEKTVLTFSDYAKQKLPDGTDKNTFLSYTLIITGNNVEIENLTVRNDAGPGDRVGQAVAVYAAGDRGVFRRCRMIAHQDTLFCGPTMKKVSDYALPYVLPIQSESVGDAGFSNNRQYFEDCLIQGDIDFIFGPYRCWFERCVLVCNDRGEPTNGYYTAANTPMDQPYGFVFHRCKLTGDGCADETVYLGRPWRAYARTVFLNCQMDPCVRREGWEDWAEKPVTHRCAEYGTIGARSDTKARHPGAALLLREEAEATTPNMVLGGMDVWTPWRPLPTVYIAGDSTAADYPMSQYPMTGWGQALSCVLEGFYVQNAAVCGRSSKSFIGEHRLERLKPCLRPGDVFLIQFGHNDEKMDAERATEPATTYPQYLGQFVDVAEQRGALPVLLTSIARRRFVRGALTDTHGAYPDAARELAKRLGLLLIDLEANTRDMIAKLGEERSKALYMHIDKNHYNYPDGEADDTHLHFCGAYAIARIVADWLRSHCQ